MRNDNFGSPAWVTTLSVSSSSVFISLSPSELQSKIVGFDLITGSQYSEWALDTVNQPVFTYPSNQTPCSFLIYWAG